MGGLTQYASLSGARRFIMSDTIKAEWTCNECGCVNTDEKFHSCVGCGEAMPLLCKSPHSYDIHEFEVKHRADYLLKHPINPHLQKRPNFKAVQTAGGEAIHCTSMVMFNDKLYVATDKGVYVMGDDDKLHPIELVQGES